MVSSRFKMKPGAINQLANSRMSGQAMEKLAVEIAKRAQANGGRFTKGYQSRVIDVDRTKGARAGTSHPFAHWDEWGNRHRTARAPLRRALSSMGLLGKTRVRSK